MKEARSILETLGTLPSGKITRLSPDQMSSFLVSKYRGRHEDDRRKEAKKRLDLFRDRGRRHFEDAIDRIFKNLLVRKWRKAFVEFAEFQNVTKRIVREVSSVYSEPARREIDGVQANERYQEFQHAVRYDRVMRKVNQFGNLLNHCLVWPDVTERGPILRTVTTDKFVAVAHPNDPCLPVAYIIDQFPNGVEVRVTDPHYLLMTEFEFVRLDKDWRVVGPPEEHGLGRLPALLWSRYEPDDCLIDGTTGADLVSAHMAVALLNALMLKHQKSGTRLAYATGDTSSMAKDQPMDEEALIEAPEGVALNTLDLGADPSNYIDAVRAVIKQVAANYGIPESVFDLSYQASSGFEIELKRTGLREIRRDQMLDFRPFEQELADLWSVVLEKSEHGAEWRYAMNKWSLDFGEIDTPQEPMAKLVYWQKLEEMGLANRVEMYLQMNPEATLKEAMAHVADNMEMRLEQMRKFQAENSGVFGPKAQGGQPRNGIPEPHLVKDEDMAVAS